MSKEGADHLKTTATTLEDRRTRGLREIFNFYSRQHIPNGKEFDEVKESMTQVDLGEFMSFSKDFKIPLTKAKLTEVFKKCSINHRPLKFPEFLKALDRVSIEWNNLRISDLTKRLEELLKKEEE